ncbi:MAG: phospholipase D-like domain-containing protein [Synergistaceae bacterium]|jgi:superfamily II DNA or RNA helicase|nr:phospholipase D-like domain-containing protein [Synergistaceae bacterium]
MPTIYDNIEHQFSDGFSKHMDGACRLDCCVGYFNLRGWGMAFDAVDKLTGASVQEGEQRPLRYCRLLVGMTKTPREEIIEEFSDPDDLRIDGAKANMRRRDLAAQLAEQLTYGNPTQADENTLKTLLRQLKSGRVVVKLFLRHQLHAKLYLTHAAGGVTPTLGLLGSSNFTLAGLSKQGELNVDVLEQDAAAKLDRWFNERWCDRWCMDITEDLINVLENSWARPDLIPPYLIYLKMAYHMSQEARIGMAGYPLPREFAKELLDFQQAAVKIAAHHLSVRHGVMIGDVVGLGKTITASAVAKTLEDDRSYNTLVTCPKNLVQMWEGYVEKYGLHAKVVSHSMLTSVLPNLRRYRLVIVDESHNFRNSLGKAYRALKEYIAANESHVILLSATPYNKSYADLASQLRLFLPDDCDLGVTPERYIESLGGAHRFALKHPGTNPRTISAFEKSAYADDWREVMKLYLVRRTRSFIKHNYAHTDEATGRRYLSFASGERSFFPDRVPKRVEFAFGGDNDQYSALYAEKVVDAIDGLALPRYGLSEYLLEDDSQANKEEEGIINNLSRAGRRVIGFCRTTLYKRLESCGYSFLLSLSRHVMRNYIFLRAIELGGSLPVSQSVPVDIYSDSDDDEDSLGIKGASDPKAMAAVLYDKFLNEHKQSFQWIRSSLFDTKSLAEALLADNRALLGIIAKAGAWRPDEDRKIDALYKLLTSGEHKGDKVLVFTQFADTAEYVCRTLRGRGVEGVDVAVGSSTNIIDTVARFSPVSNGHPQPANPIRVLVTTDVLSEGQNLQDAHVVVNFDLPWAIVRLIQRAGRVDRLGQKAHTIFCYSFLPENGIERIIGLREKLATRISQNAEVVGSDEVFFEGDAVNIADLYSEKAGILDEEGDREVDLASYAYQIWKNATEAHPGVKAKVENMPNRVFSAKAGIRDGVIVYARTNENNDALAIVDRAGKVVTQAQYEILEAAECAYDTPALPKSDGHHELVEKGVREIQKETTSIGGTLGGRNSVKRRVYDRMTRFAEENPLFAPQELKQALDAIYNHPMKEAARDALSRQMRSGIDDQGLAELLTSLHDEGTLCDMTEGMESNCAQIVCSMGLIA